MKQILHFFAVLALSLFTSCSTTKVLSTPSALNKKTVMTVTHKSPDFIAVSPGKAIVAGLVSGVVGVSLMAKTGNDIVRENGVQDPSTLVGQQLGATLERKYAVKMIGTRQSEGVRPSEIAKTCPGADYALDVNTVGWGMAYYPLHVKTYRALYNVHVRLIDCKTGDVVAESMYYEIRPRTDSSRDWDQLVEVDKASGLKTELREAAQNASSKISQTIFP